MTDHQDRLRPIISMLLAFASVMFILTPVFNANSSHFNWGFGAMMFLVLPLFYITPVALIIQGFKFKKTGPTIQELMIYLLTLVLWLGILWFFSQS
jgi:hypothetical protein